jgi:hypothetical protein
LLVFLAGWSMGTMHQLLSHHDHGDKISCILEAEHDPDVAHIHDERYENDHCSLCAFLLSTPELLSISAVLKAVECDPVSRDSFHCTASPARAAHDTTCLRGPPVL